MRQFLVEEPAPFGVVHESRTVAANPPYRGSPNAIGPTHEISNHGAEHGPSFDDKGAGATAYACRNAGNPFYWVGHPGK